MSIEHQRRVLEVLDEVLEAPAEKRAALLAELCGDDVALSEEVRALVEAEEPGGLLGMPAFDVHSQDDPALGRTIGDYELVELLGRGGMGTVYLARRESFEQRVAIKIIRRGLDLDPVLVQRFENERAILARLEHPSIARLLDGGTTGDGLPYVVMEYVRGAPIDAYCRRHDLDLRARLELFCQVLDAVQYAHRNLVVHRDLKPGNILVDAEGSSNGSPGSSPESRVKLLDFGIAKLLDESLAASPLHTATGEAPMTPRYASPEQIRRQPISTASDVYVLGVLLFELLTGLDAYGADTSDPSLLSRAVLEREPERPSTAVRRRAPELSASEIKRLRSRLAGDLDAIVGKAMRKEPGERYGSVEQLADDIRRHLGGEPVRARRGTFGYRAGKFVRRHRVALVVVAMLFGVLATASIVSYSYFRNAERSADRLERTVRFMQDLIGASSFGDVAVAEALALEQEGIEQNELDVTEMKDRVEITRLLGRMWRRSGKFRQARYAMAKSYQWALQAYGPEHTEVQKSLNNYFAVLVDLEDYEDAELLFREMLEELEARRTEFSRDGDDGDFLLNLDNLVFRGKSNLATVLKHKGDLAEAERLHRDLLAAREHRYRGDYGPHDPDIASSRHNLAAVLYAKGDSERALELASLALATRERTNDRGKLWRIPSTRRLIGQILSSLGRHRGASKVLETALLERVALYGRFDHRTAEVERHLAEALLEWDPERAEALLVEAIATFERRLEESWRTDDARSVLALLQARRGELEDPTIAKESYERLAQVRGERSTVTKRAKARWQEVERLTASRPDASSGD